MVGREMWSVGPPPLHVEPSYTLTTLGSGVRHSQHFVISVQQRIFVQGLCGHKLMCKTCNACNAPGGGPSVLAQQNCTLPPGPSTWASYPYRRPPRSLKVRAFLFHVGARVVF